MQEQVLPIVAHTRDILEAIRRNQVVVLSAETGAGKTTYVPRLLHENGFGQGGMIGVTQPRKVAAMSVSAFVAEQMGCRLGTTVGYQIRHKRMVDDRTAIKFMTDGILLRELQDDPLLRKYRVLVLDEMHERNLNQDFILGLVKRALPLRPDLKVVVMSATINEEVFAAYFGAEIVRVEGRRFPVAVEYLDHDLFDPIEAAVEATASVLKRVDGDVLVFMPDRASIDKTARGLADLALGVEILPLYGSQSPEEQYRVFVRRGRRIIVATNIAETSITLDGVAAVVDTGLIKQMTYLPGTGMSSLQAVPHSRAGCDQRTGRAGRTAPGLCLRLYTRFNYDERPAFTPPEILRSSVEQMILQMKAMGMDDATIDDFGFLDAPSGKALAAARATLRSIGAIDGEGNLTADGRFMSEIPLPPVVTRMILSARAFGCVAPVITIAATFSTRDIFVRPQEKKGEADTAHAKFRVPSSDFLMALKAIEAWKESANRWAFARANFLHGRALEEILATERQISDLLIERGIEISQERDAALIAMSVAAGLLGNLLVHNGGESHTYTGTTCGGVWIFPGSNLFKRDPHLMVAAAIVETEKAYARGCQVVTLQMLRQILPPSDINMAPPRFHVDVDSEPPVLRCEFDVSWRHIKLGTEVVEDLRGPEILNPVVNEIIEEHRDPFGHRSSRGWHPDVSKNIRKIGEFGRRFTSFRRPTEDDLLAFYLERLQGIVSIEGALARDLAMDLDARLSEADREALHAPPVFERSPASLSAAGRWASSSSEEAESEMEQLGALARGALEKEMNVCPLCGRKFFIDSCGWHDTRRLLFGESSCVLLTLTTDAGQEIARLIAYKENGRVVRQRSDKLNSYGYWRGRSFTQINVKRCEGAIVPFSVSSLDACTNALEEMKRWKAEAEKIKKAEADLKTRIGRGHVARVECVSGQSGRLLVVHRSTEYMVPYDANPYPVPGETWYWELSLPMQGKATARPLYRQAPSAKEEEELVDALLGDFRSTYGFVPSGF